MASRIEDYAIIGDTATVALVDKTGSVDWWCAPRIDSGACFAALLGTAEHGRWRLAPAAEVTSVSRSYETDTLVLETVMTTAEGSIAIIDFMPPCHTDPTIHRIVEGRTGTVQVDMELIVRFDYGSITPWVRSTGDGLTMMAGAEGLRFHSPVPIEGRDMHTISSFEVSAGDRQSFSLTWFSSGAPAPLPLDSLASLHRTRHWWREWASQCTYEGNWRDDVIRSLITLKALSYAPSGAIAAAATTSLPEWIGSVRNWDYRFSWLRDATFTLEALLLSGYHTEATAWAHWLRRAVAGNPGDFQIMYAVGGERRLDRVRGRLAPRVRGLCARTDRQPGVASSSSWTSSAKSWTPPSPRRAVGSSPSAGSATRSWPDSSATWRRCGTPPMTASGKCVDLVGTSPTRR